MYIYIYYLYIVILPNLATHSDTSGHGEFGDSGPREPAAACFCF